MRIVSAILLFCCTTMVSQTAYNYSINGVFSNYLTKYYDSTNSYLLQNKSVSAYFSQSPSLQILMNTRINAGEVEYNNQMLSYENNMNFYSHNTIDTTSGTHWQVSGNSSISEMNFVFNGAMPNFNISDSLICDTLIKSDTMYVKLENLTNTDSISIEFFDDSLGVILHKAIVIAPNYTNSYALPPPVYQSLKSGLRAIIKVEAINYSYQIIAEKQFLFRNIYSYAKYRIPIVSSSP